MSNAATTVIDGMSFLEGPRWHDGRIWVSDFYTQRVLSALPDGSDLRVEAEVATQPSGLGWLPDGRLLIVSMRDQRVLRREDDGSLSTHADLSHLTGTFLNDMVVDEKTGRAYVGAFGFDLMNGAPLQTSYQYRVEPDGTVDVAASGLYFPNGPAITADGELLIAESFGNRVSAFPIAADGTLGERRDWAKFGDLPTSTVMEEVYGQIAVAPDGTCLAPDGTLWVADALGSRAIRVADGGEIVQEVPTESPIYACALGGENMDTLFVCAAPDSAEHNRRDVREARLLAIGV